MKRSFEFSDDLEGIVFLDNESKQEFDIEDCSLFPAKKRQRLICEEVGSSCSGYGSRASCTDERSHDTRAETRSGGILNQGDLFEDIHNQTSFPRNGCFICVDNDSVDLQLANGFVFALGKHTMQQINQSIEDCFNAGANAGNTSAIPDQCLNLHFMSLLNDICQMCHDSETNQSFFGDGAAIADSFLLKHNLSANTNDCKLDNKSFSSVEYIWENEDYQFSWTELIGFLGSFEEHLAHDTRYDSLLPGLFENDRRVTRTVGEWYNALERRHDGTENEELAGILSMVAKMRHVVKPSYQFRLKNDFWLLLNDNTQFQSYWDGIQKKKGKASNINYYHIQTCDDKLCFGKFERDLISNLIHRNAQCMNGLPYLCDIIGDYCALSDNTQLNRNSQLLFDCFKKQFDNYAKKQNQQRKAKIQNMNN